MKKPFALSLQGVFVLLSGTEEKDTSCVVDRFGCCLCNSLYHCPFSFSIVFRETKVGKIFDIKTVVVTQRKALILND